MSTSYTELLSGVRSLLGPRSTALALDFVASLLPPELLDTLTEQRPLYAEVTREQAWRATLLTHSAVVLVEVTPQGRRSTSVALEEITAVRREGGGVVLSLPDREVHLSGGVWALGSRSAALKRVGEVLGA